MEWGGGGGEVAVGIKGVTFAPGDPTNVVAGHVRGVAVGEGGRV